MSISGCAYSRNAKLLVTASVDTEGNVDSGISNAAESFYWPKCVILANEMIQLHSCKM